MDTVDLLKKLSAVVQKYKVAVIILLAGLALMLLPNETEEGASHPVEQTPTVPMLEQDLEDRLAAVLRQIRGAGEVCVLLTERTGSQTLYHADTESDEGNGSASLRSNTVITEDKEHSESPLIVRVDPPVYQGAVIICQGADDPQVKLAIVEAVRCATGLGADQITVIKMK